MWRMMAMPAATDISDDACNSCCGNTDNINNRRIAMFMKTMIVPTKKTVTRIETATVLFAIVITCNDRLSMIDY